MEAVDNETWQRVNAAVKRCDCMASKLIELANGFKAMPKKLIVATGSKHATDIEVLAVAIKFVQLPPATLLRAMIEAWSYSRCVQEVH